MGCPFLIYCSFLKLGGLYNLSISYLVVLNRRMSFFIIQHLAGSIVLCKGFRLVVNTVCHFRYDSAFYTWIPFSLNDFWKFITKNGVNEYFYIHLLHLSMSFFSYNIYLNPSKVNKLRTKIITATIIEICSNLASLTSSYYLYLTLQVILPIANKTLL